MGVRQGRLALDVIRQVASYFLRHVEVKDYGDKLIIQIKSDEDAYPRRNSKFDY